MLYYIGIGDIFMKVISIKEPFATLITNGMKKIETRSWKTNYRGEIFIHASGKSIAKEFLTNDFVVDLVKDMDMNFGNIICRCNLVDCIYMDETFLEYIKQNPTEYNVGEYKLGRYAWIMENIEPIHSIPTKGKLNIQTFDGEYKFINQIKSKKGCDINERDII